MFIIWPSKFQRKRTRLKRVWCFPRNGKSVGEKFGRKEIFFAWTFWFWAERKFFHRCGGCRSRTHIHMGNVLQTSWNLVGILFESYKQDFHYYFSKSGCIVSVEGNEVGGWLNRICKFGSVWVLSCWVWAERNFFRLNILSLGGKEIFFTGVVSVCVGDKFGGKEIFFRLNILSLGGKNFFSTVWWVHCRWKCRLAKKIKNELAH